MIHMLIINVFRLNETVLHAQSGLVFINKYNLEIVLVHCKLATKSNHAVFGDHTLKSSEP